MNAPVQNVLQLANVSRHFGGVPAVDDVSLDVPAGRITGLIGTNGAGKTTLVNLVMGLFHLSSGSVRLDGRDVSLVEAPDLARAGLARTFQNIRLIPNGTVLNNVLLGFQCRRRVGFWAEALALPGARAQEARDREAAMALLDRFEMTHLAQHRGTTLSYGHQRRIEMMRALAMQPRVLLLDEPVAGMNDTEAESLGRIFREVADTGVAVLLIEHNMRFVSATCSYLYVLAAGRMIAQGTPETVLQDPDVVAAYLGAEQ
ncbi:ABC transporter ATP-binding protein [Variovorax defluvii]|uniref:ABC transporter ATP-binding protein n=1 Tax=Variovorax defluvii TaxID=913761 RepID=A0ABP8I931_9BURK